MVPGTAVAFGVQPFPPSHCLYCSRHPRHACTLETPMRPSICRPLAPLALLASANVARAQTTYRPDSDAEWLEQCRNNGGRSGNDDRGRACEVREVPVKLSGRSIAVDGRQNGSIRVFGGA